MAMGTQQPTDCRRGRNTAPRYLVPWSAQSSAGGDPQFIRAAGSYLHDENDTAYFDFSSGWIAANLGHGHQEIANRVADQLMQLDYAPPIFEHPLRERVASRLSDLSPWDEGARVHFTTGGGEANDDAMKVARLLTGRHKIMAAYRSYHGTTLGASGATGDMRRWANEPAAPSVVRFFAPYPYRSPFHTDDPEEEVDRAIDHLERILTQENPDSIAALIIEPFVGSSGVIVYPDGYLRRLREITEYHGILLIFDEVMSGFGRLGAPFGAERLGVAPDMIVFAKGVNGAVLPLGGLMIRESFAQAFDEMIFDAGHTHAGHLVVLASADAALDIYERDGLFHRAMSLEPVFQCELNGLQREHSLIGDVRGLGAFFGLELVRDRSSRTPLVEWYAKDRSLTARLTALLLEEGVWAYCRYSIVMLAPPLVASDAELRSGIEAIGRALTRLAAEI